MELVEPSENFEPVRDPRPHMPEPPPVRIVAISDVRLTTVAGLEKLLDEFYVTLLKFERDTEDEAHIAYHAERHRVVFDVVEVPPEREDYRPLQVMTPHLTDFVDALNERGIPYEWQKGVAPGIENIFLQDPAGNWVLVAPLREVR